MVDRARYRQWNDYRFRTGNRVVLGGITALHGEVGTVRGCRTAATQGHDYFVYFDREMWPGLPENGIWAHESHLTLESDDQPAVVEAERLLRVNRK